MINKKEFYEPQILKDLRLNINSIESLYSEGLLDISYLVLVKPQKRYKNVLG